MPENEPGFRVYPRGFLGGDIRPQVVRSSKPFTETINRYQYSVDVNGGGSNNIVANPLVEGVYSDYIKNVISTNSFDFRKRVLQVALSSFGTSDFATWYLTQFKSPAAGDLHNRFLEDTLRFIDTGTRDMPLETWQALLHITDEGNNIGKVTNYAKEFFGIGSQYKPNSKLTAIIQRWCTKVGGIEDLLGTMHILFGNVNV